MEAKFESLQLQRKEDSAKPRRAAAQANGFVSRPARRTPGGPAGPSAPRNTRRASGGPVGPVGPVGSRVSGRVVSGGKQVEKARVRRANKAAPPMIDSRLPKGHPLPKGGKPEMVTLHGTHTTTAATSSAHAHDSHGESHGEHGDNSNAFNGIGTLIINAEDGTVNVHIHGAEQITPPAPNPNARTNSGANRTPPRPGPNFEHEQADDNASVSLRMAREAFRKARSSKAKPKKKPSKKKSSKQDDAANKKKSSKKINDETLSA
jgi:hypothetical protein